MPKDGFLRFPVPWTFRERNRITVKALRPEGGRVQLAADEIYLIP